LEWEQEEGRLHGREGRVGAGGREEWLHELILRRKREGRVGVGAGGREGWLQDLILRRKREGGVAGGRESGNIEEEEGRKGWSGSRRKGGW
jgi:hypothetical protein